MWRMTCERVTYCDMKNKFVDGEAILIINTFSILPHFIQSWCPYLRSMENPHLEMTDKESQRANSLSRWIIGGFLVNNSSRWSGNLNLNFNSTLLQNTFSYCRGSPNSEHVAEQRVDKFVFLFLNIPVKLFSWVMNHCIALRVLKSCAYVRLKIY